MYVRFSDSIPASASGDVELFKKGGDQGDVSAASYVVIKGDYGLRCLVVCFGLRVQFVTAAQF